MQKLHEFIFQAKQRFLSDFSVCRNAPLELKTQMLQWNLVYVYVLEKSIICELTSNTPFCRIEH